MKVEGFRTARLTAADAPELQDLFERASDFFEMCDDGPPRPDAALTELTHVPEGFTPDDLVAFGFWRERLDGIVGLLREPRGEATWWIGLLLLDPAARVLIWKRVPLTLRKRMHFINQHPELAREQRSVGQRAGAVFPRNGGEAALSNSAYQRQQNRQSRASTQPPQHVSLLATVIPTLNGISAAALPAPNIALARGGSTRATVIAWLELVNGGPHERNERFPT